LTAGALVAERRASWLELFFDLVLVAAVAALASLLHEDSSATGLAVYAGLFVPVWWAWWGFTWYSAAFNDDDTVNRLALFAGMAGVAAMAAGVSGAAHARSGTFVVAIAALLALLAALYARAWIRIPAARALSGRYAAGDASGATLWLASLAVSEGLRPVVWGVPWSCSWPLRSSRPRRRTSCPTTPGTSPSATASSPSSSSARRWPGRSRASTRGRARPR
jgi:low temperature requirement protein LtrA